MTDIDIVEKSHKYGCQCISDLAYKMKSDISNVMNSHVFHCNEGIRKCYEQEETEMGKTSITGTESLELKRYLEENKRDSLSENEKEELKSRFKALSRSELEYILDFIPIEFCLKKIEKDLKNYTELKQTISNAFINL